MKYRKKPVVIEAVQFREKKDSAVLFSETPIWLKEAMVDGRIISNDNDHTLTIKTLEGNHTANLNDYIIRGIKDELYPCKPDIFEMTYEKVE